MDSESEIANGKVGHSPELERWIKLYKDWQQDGYSAIIIQQKVRR